MFVEASKPVTVHDSCYGMIVQSGNDAAIALAELVGGSERTSSTLMNAAAKNIGMKNTHFAERQRHARSAALHDRGRPRRARRRA